MISLGNIDFNNDTPDSDGNLWYGYFDGWDTIAQRIADIQPPGRHGGITVMNLFEPRQLTLYATAVCVDAAGYYAAKNLIFSETNALNPFLDTPLTLTVEEEIDRVMYLLRTSIRTECIIEDQVLKIEATFRADDPLKYSATETTLATSGTAVNTGDTFTFPTFTLTAPGAPILTLGPLTWGSAALPSGTVIDMREMTVLDGPTNYFSEVQPESVWFPLQPGNNTVASTVAGTWAWKDAWQ
jgi:hypothetical protein